MIKSRLSQISFILLIIFLVNGLALCSSISFPLKKLTKQESKSRFLSNSSFGIKNNSNQQYLVQVKVGTSQTQLNLLLDTRSDQMWIVSKTCSGCGSGYPNRYNCVTSDKCTLNTGNTSSGSAIQSNGNSVSGTTGSIQIQLPDGNLITYPFLYVTSGTIQETGLEDGILGIGTYDPNNSGSNNDNWINVLFHSGVLTQNQYTLYLDSSDNANENSQLMLGDYDKAKFIKNYATASISTHLVTSTEGLWSVKTTKVIYGDTVLGEGSYDTLIDSAATYLSLPTELYQALKNTLINTYKLTFNSADDAFYNNCESTFPSFSFQLPNISNDDVVYVLEPDFYALYDSKDKQCGFFITETSDSIVLGQSFMRKYITTFKYETDLFIDMAQSITSGTPLPVLSNNSNNNDSSFPLWAKIVIPIAAVLIISVIAFLIVRNCRKKRMETETKQQRDESNTSQASIEQTLY